MAFSKKSVKILNAFSNNFLKFNGDFEKFEKVYFNFCQMINEELKNNSLFTVQKLEFSIEQYFNLKNVKKNNSMQDLNDFITYINKILQINKADHFFVVSAQNSSLSSKFQINNRVFFVPQDPNINNMISDISSYTQINNNDVDESLNHTVKSRSPDFMKSNLIIFRDELQTETAKDNCRMIIQRYLFAIKIVHEYYDIEEDLLMRNRCCNLERNYHVSILANESWRRGHLYTYNFDSKINYDLSFLNSPEKGNLLTNIMDFTNKKSQSKFKKKIDKTIYFYGLAMTQIDQYNERYNALILFFISLELLISASYQSKRQCLSRVIAEILGKNSSDKKKIESKINELYIKRNNLIHEGNEDYLYGKDDSDDIKFLSSITSRVIVYAIDFYNSNEFVTDVWEKHINTIYRETKDNKIIILLNKMKRKKK